MGVTLSDSGTQSADRFEQKPVYRTSEKGTVPHMVYLIHALGPGRAPTQIGYFDLPL
jgi:hypothetical protein